MVRERKEPTAKTTKKLILCHVSEAEEQKQVLFALRSCRINGWRNGIAVKMGNFHKSGWSIFLPSTFISKYFHENFDMWKIFKMLNHKDYSFLDVA